MQDVPSALLLPELVIAGRHVEESRRFRLRQVGEREQRRAREIHGDEVVPFVDEPPEGFGDVAVRGDDRLVEHEILSRETAGGVVVGNRCRAPAMPSSAGGASTNELGVCCGIRCRRVADPDRGSFRGGAGAPAEPAGACCAKRRASRTGSTPGPPAINTP